MLIESLLLAFPDDRTGRHEADVDHAVPVGDRFVVLNRGRMFGSYEKGEIDRDDLVQAMAGGAELAQLTHELESAIVETTSSGHMGVNVTEGGYSDS